MSFVLVFLLDEERLKKDLVDCFAAMDSQNEAVAYFLDSLDWNCYMAVVAEVLDFRKAVEDLDNNFVG